MSAPSASRGAAGPRRGRQRRERQALQLSPQQRGDSPAAPHRAPSGLKAVSQGLHGRWPDPADLVELLDRGEPSVLVAELDDVRRPSPGRSPRSCRAARRSRSPARSARPRSRSSRLRVEAPPGPRSGITTCWPSASRAARLTALEQRRAKRPARPADRIDHPGSRTAAGRRPGGRPPRRRRRRCRPSPRRLRSNEPLPEPEPEPQDGRPPGSSPPPFGADRPDADQQHGDRDRAVDGDLGAGDLGHRARVPRRGRAVARAMRLERDRAGAG